MGLYMNPGNLEFREMLNDVYVDKSGMLELINSSIDTPRRLTCVSRPRRFGKSYAAKMLCAYYDRSCDSASLFDGLEISSSSSYRKYMNRYNVLYLDMTNMLGKVEDKSRLIPFVQEELRKELHREIPGLPPSDTIDGDLLNAVTAAGCKFIMIIDE